MPDQTPAAAPSAFEWTLAWARGAALKYRNVDETASTNTDAKDDADPRTAPVLSGPADVSTPSLYITRRQTSGRGRGTHVWTTPEGASLPSSWSFAVARIPQPIFSALVGLALFESGRAAWPALAFNVKAPNDLFIGDKKTAGLLIETVDQGVSKRTVIGLGFNVTGKPADLDTATCLADHLRRAPSQDEWTIFLNEWSRRLTAAVNAGLASKLEPEAAERLRAALNLHPFLKEPILRVDELGQLQSASRTIFWHEL